MYVTIESVFIFKKKKSFKHKENALNRRNIFIRSYARKQDTVHHEAKQEEP